MIVCAKFYLGIIAGLISSLAYFIYFRSILKRETRPNRVTWLIWTFMGAIMASSYYFSGARNTIWSPIVEFIGPLVTAILSIKYGEGGTADKTDIFCFVGGLMSIALWIVFDAPIIALIISLAIDGFAIIPTIKKSYLRPQGESFWAWSWTGIGDFLNLLASERFVFTIVIYPAWMLFNDLIVVLLLGLGKQKISTRKSNTARSNS